MGTIRNFLLAVAVIGAVGCDDGGKGEMFPDPAFKACVEEKINYDANLDILDKNDPDLYDKIYMLACEGGGIKNIKGIEHMPNIDWLAITDNQVESLEPLRTLTKLEFLKLDNNKIKNLEPLSGLTILSTLSLSDNYIEDISPLFTLTNLGSVWLNGNCITDAGQFQELKQHSPDVQTGGAENSQTPAKCQ